MAESSNTRRRNAPLPRQRKPKRKTHVFDGKRKRNNDVEVTWLRVIEYLASFKEINSATLYELLDAAPKFPEKMVKNTKEMVALRCLEELFGTSDRSVHEGPFVTGDEVVFDVSISCEEALQCIIDMTSKGKFLRWDIHPFIMHKRASIPQCALEQLKDAILEGKPPCTSILRKHSGLAQTNDTHHPAACYAGASRVNDSNTAVRDIASSENSPIAIENDAVIGGDLLDESREFSYLPCEMNREFSIENIMGDCHENDDGNDLESEAKRSRRDGKQPMDCVLVSECGKEFMEHTSASMDKTDHAEASTERTEEDTFIGQAVEHTDIGNQIKSSNVASLGAYRGKGNLDEAEGNKEPLSKDYVSSADKVDISARKNQFLRSQCPGDNDSPSELGWTEQNLCVKCNKDGTLLFCSLPDCPLVVHENCLGAAASFDDKGDFVCPFCAYSRAVSEYAEAKKRVSFAKKQLTRCV